MGIRYDERQSPLRGLDWLTVLLYIALLAFGWVSICGASYTPEGATDFFDFATRPGKQLVWIGCSLGLSFVLLMLDDRIYDAFAYLFYIAFMLLLLVTPFIAKDVKGSYSWIQLGTVSLQPAEFAKCATALAIAKLMGSYSFSLDNRRHFLQACLLIFLPIALIVLQRETGSALVYLAFFLMFYREGMNGGFLFAAFAAVVFFVVGIRYDAVLFAGETPIGAYAVLLLIWLFALGMLRVYSSVHRHALRLLGWGIVWVSISTLVAVLWLPYNISVALLAGLAALVAYLCYHAFREQLAGYFYIALAVVGSIAFYYSSDYVLDHVLEPHQQIRVKVLLGMEEDLAGAGYNVNQSMIAIGSGGLTGKGFLNGTQTKLKYVPEQDTDFIFCTVGEEEGFWGAATVLLLFLFLILRLIRLSERQTYAFGRVYGYCVLSIFLFHVFINVGMVMGLTPVIGIPLPFFSYGGSSLWGFTILLFIFLRIDASRNRWGRN